MGLLGEGLDSGMLGLGTQAGSLAIGTEMDSGEGFDKKEGLGGDGRFCTPGAKSWKSPEFSDSDTGCSSFREEGNDILPFAGGIWVPIEDPGGWGSKLLQGKQEWY